MFPEGLLDDPAASPGDRRWWVLYTKARQEKSLARDLFALQVPFYLPKVKKTQITRGRRTNSFVPLFAGYVFLWGSEQERVRSLMTNRISRVIAVNDPERLLFDLRQLAQLIAVDAPLTIESQLEAGDRVRVRQGPLMGLEGTVLTRRGITRLLVAVDFLQQGASVEIDDYLLEPL
jgi:transcription antitermination factor NusG